MEQISIRYQGKVISADKGTTAVEALSRFSPVDCSRIIAVMVNNQIRELNYRLQGDCDLEPIDITTGDGQRIYIRSLVFIFIRACREVFPDCKVSIEHSFGGGLYCEVHGGFTLTPKQVHRIEQQMRKIVEADEPFVKIDTPIEEAKEIFREMGFTDKLELLRYRKEDRIPLYKCGWMYDYLYGYMLPSTGCLKIFGLKFYLPGVVLRYPDKENPSELAPFEDSPKLFTIFRQSEKWAKIINIENVADLNRRIEEGWGGSLSGSARPSMKSRSPS